MCENTTTKNGFSGFPFKVKNFIKTFITVVEKLVVKHSVLRFIHLSETSRVFPYLLLFCVVKAHLIN